MCDMRNRLNVIKWIYLIEGNLLDNNINFISNNNNVIVLICIGHRLNNLVNCSIDDESKFLK